GPDEEADGEDGHRAEKGRDRVPFLEELDGQDRGQAPEDVEVVPLDDVADGRRDDDAAELLERNLGCPHWPPLSHLRERHGSRRPRLALSPHQDGAVLARTLRWSIPCPR